MRQEVGDNFSQTLHTHIYIHTQNGRPHLFVVVLAPAACVSVVVVVAAVVVEALVAFVAAMGSAVVRVARVDAVRAQYRPRRRREPGTCREGGPRRVCRTRRPRRPPAAVARDTVATSFPPAAPPRAVPATASTAAFAVAVAVADVAVTAPKQQLRLCLHLPTHDLVHPTPPAKTLSTQRKQEVQMGSRQEPPVSSSI